jgi:hypothetical protein
MSVCVCVWRMDVVDGCASVIKTAREREEEMDLRRCTRGVVLMCVFVCVCVCVCVSPDSANECVCVCVCHLLITALKVYSERLLSSDNII